MRLVDPSQVGKLMKYYGFSAPDMTITEFVEDELTDIPAVPVVRCRECKHFNLITHECENELLSTDHEGGASYSLNFYDDDFCSYGELRETSHD